MKLNILKRCLILRNGGEISLEKLSKKGLKIGLSEKAAINIDGDYIHPKHAILSPYSLNENQTAITALMPGYPVLINGKPILINNATVLLDGDVISIGNYDMSITDHFNSLKKMGNNFRLGLFVALIALILWVINDYHYSTIFDSNLETLEKSLKLPAEMSFTEEREYWEKADNAYKRMIFWGLLDKSKLEEDYKVLSDAVIKMLIYKELDPSDITNSEKNINTRIKNVSRGYKNTLNQELPEFMQQDIENFFEFNDLFSKSENDNALMEAYLEKITNLKISSLLNEYIVALKEELYKF